LVRKNHNGLAQGGVFVAMDGGGRIFRFSQGAQMLRRLIFLVLSGFFLVSCGTSMQVETTRTPSQTPSITSSLTPIPTATNSPTPTATPYAGGGQILMILDRANYPGDSVLDGDMNIFLAEPDGSGLRPITDLAAGLYPYFVGLSPDQRFAAIYMRGGWDMSSYILNFIRGKGTETSLYILDILNEQLFFVTDDVRDQDRGLHPVLWLSDGRLAFVAQDTDGKFTIYIVDPTDQELIKLTKPPLTGFMPRSLIATSVDGSGLYWAAGTPCRSRGICDEKYYFTRLDDSDQQQVWQIIQGASDNIYFSPTGEYLSYNYYFDNYRYGCFIAPISGIDVLTSFELKVDEKRVGMCLHNNWSPDGNSFLIYSWEYMVC
jgi:hypothetical protein